MTTILITVFPWIVEIQRRQLKGNEVILIRQANFFFIRDQLIQSDTPVKFFKINNHHRGNKKIIFIQQVKAAAQGADPENTRALFDDCPDTVMIQGCRVSRDMCIMAKPFFLPVKFVQTSFPGPCCGNG